MSSIAPFARPAVKIYPQKTSPQISAQRPAKKRSQYLGSTTGRLTNPNVSNIIYDINTLIAAHGNKLRGRVQDLQRNFPHMARAINARAAFIVKNGIKHQARIIDKEGNLILKLNQHVEDSFNFWADQADSSGKLHFYEIQDLICRQEFESGEYLIVKRYKKEPGQFIPYSLDIHESWDVLDTSMDDYGYKRNGTFETRLGIKYNRATGKPVSYFFKDPDDYGFGKTKEIPASQIIHGFKTIRPRQLRGITPFSSGILLANDLDDYMQATLDSAKMAAKYLAMVTSPDPVSAQLGMSEVDSDEDLRIEEIENAIITYLGEGEKVDFAKNPNPGNNFPPYVKFLISMVAITTNTPYEILSGDYSGYTFVNLRVSRNDLKQFLEPEQDRLIRHFCNPVYRDFIDIATMSGSLNLPGYNSNPWVFYRAEWQPPGMPSIDPLKESKASNDQISNNIKSPQEVVKERGRDLEEVYREIQQANFLKEKYGLTDKETSTALAGAPSAVEGQK